MLALIGGAMIGAAAVMLMAVQGSIMGISGIVSRLLPPLAADRMWRVSFLLGILAAPILWLLVTGRRPPVDITDNPLLLILGGLLVGAGTVIGNGCTSGHGVCGLSRVSGRSIIATGVFVGVAVATVWVTSL